MLSCSNSIYGRDRTGRPSTSFQGCLGFRDTGWTEHEASQNCQSRVAPGSSAGSLRHRHLPFRCRGAPTHSAPEHSQDQRLVILSALSRQPQSPFYGSQFEQTENHCWMQAQQIVSNDTCLHELECEEYKILP